MSEPAIQASRRAFESLWPDQGGFEFNYVNSSRWWADLAAEEAIRPIRGVFERWDGTHLALSPQARAILDEIAPFLYSSEELER